MSGLNSADLSSAQPCKSVSYSASMMEAVGYNVDQDADKVLCKAVTCNKAKPLCRPTHLLNIAPSVLLLVLAAFACKQQPVLHITPRDTVSKHFQTSFHKPDSSFL